MHITLMTNENSCWNELSYSKYESSLQYEFSLEIVF